MNDKRNIMRASDVMTQRYLKMEGLSTVADAMRAIYREDANAVIINKRDEDDEYGIVLLSDIAKKVLAQDRAPERVNLYEIMSKPVIGISPDMDVRYVARLFDGFGLAHAPVMKDGQILGLICYDDLVLKGLAHLHQE